MNGAIPGNFNHRAERRSTASKLEDVAEIARGAYGNEQKTRERVDALETNTKRCQALLSRGFLGRLRWLLTGR